MRLIAVAFAAQGIVMSMACSPSEHLRAVREVPLSQYRVTPYVIVGAADGGYVVAGSEDDDDRPWAARFDSAGKQLWEFLDGPLVRASGDNAFKGAVLLTGKRTLLCGIKGARGEDDRAHLVVLDDNGAVSAERDIYPLGDPTRYSVRFDKCIRWGDGVAVLGFANRRSESHGWLVKLDLTGEVKWEKFIPPSGPRDVLETANHELLVLSADDIDTRDSRLDRLSTDGTVLLTRHIRGDSRFVRPYAGDAVTHITSETGEQTLFFEVGLQFQDLKPPISLGRSTPNTGYDLADKSSILFGGLYNGGSSKAGVIRVFESSASAELPLESSQVSFWFYDALPMDRPNEFATVRETHSGAVLTWIAIER